MEVGEGRGGGGHLLHSLRLNPVSVSEKDFNESKVLCENNTLELI